MDVSSKPRGRPKDEQLTARRCEEILDVAARIFAERGFGSTDLQIVADQLGIGKGTIYRYFPTKRDLFLAAVDRGMRRLTETVDGAAAAGHSPLATMELAIRAYLEFFQSNPHIVELLIQERAEFRDRPKPTYFEYRDGNIGKWRTLLQGLIDSGLVRRELPMDTITGVGGDLIYGAMVTNYFARRRLSAHEQAREIITVLLAGILTNAGRDEWARVSPVVQTADGNAPEGAS